ncbi:MAG: DUF1572 family protein [Acidobacteriaceae bacterium]
MAHHFTTSYLEDALVLFRESKKLAERAMAQVTEEQLFSPLDPETNSIAIIVKHLSGNMRSRWTDFLTTDGETPERNRDGEFLDPPLTRQALLETWEDGWGRLFEALELLSEADLVRTVTIRGEPHSVMQAINRQVAHYGHHVGQIVLLARALCRPSMEIADRAQESIHGIQAAGGIGTAKPEVNCRILGFYQKRNGNSPRSISSSPSPERIDENVPRRIAA